MKQKNSLILDDEFIRYCELNNIDDVQKLARDTFNRGYYILKYGESPFLVKGKEVIIEKETIKEVPVEVIVEKEKIVEVIKEIPVEVIVEKEKIVEVIKEVPIQIKGDEKIVEVIKEVPVEKIVEVIKEIKNDDELNKLVEENKKLKEELEKITTSLESLNKAKYMKNSNMNSIYDE